MISLTYPFLLLLLIILTERIRRLKRRAIRDVRGPASTSWLLGHERTIRAQAQVGDLDFEWMYEYGNVWRTKSCWNEDVLMIADPKAIQHIFQTSAYNYPKRADLVQLSKLVIGRGILGASGADHPRHRKVMGSAFSSNHLKTYLPIFRSHAMKVSQKWHDQVNSNESSDGSIINVAHWLSRATLDIIGIASFDYSFGALDHIDNELVNEFKNLFTDCSMYPATWNLLFQALWGEIPTFILRFVEYMPTREYRRFRQFLNLTKRIAKQLIDEKSANVKDSNKDVLSLLVQANRSESPKHRLDEDEVLSQMATLMFAGHDTTALALSWTLYELAKNHDDQDKIRAEIRHMRCKILQRGESDFTAGDLDAMTFTNAAIKESMRLHPIISQLVRTAARDDVIPLANPIKTESGKFITEVPISKGQNITASVCGYNRLPEIWGIDAEEWNPKRFLENGADRQSSAGLWDNLMTFSSGVRGCLGWRFAVMEMQVILIELIENFEFRPLEGMEILRVPAGAMIPMVRDKMHEGSQLPLHVYLIPRGFGEVRL